MSTDYRQGQGPFGGDVRPSGNVLMLQEEFEAGKPTGGTPFGPRGTAAARLQDRWLNWNPFTLPAQLFRWLDPIAQRFSLYAPGPVAVPETNTCRWAGNVLRLPNAMSYLEPAQEDGERQAWLTAFAGVSAGPGQVLLDQFAQNRAVNYGALVVSSGDLSLADQPFTALGLQQASDPADPVASYQWKGRAFMANWNGAGVAPSTLRSFEIASLGALFRLDMLLEFEPAEGEDPPELNTELIGFVSNDGGRGWTYVGSSLLKGPTDINAPVTIGFGASSTSEPDALPNPIAPIECTGGFDFLRVYQQPFSELNIILNPDGGRNWP